MDAAALNLTTQVLGFGRFLFIDLASSKVDSALVKALDRAGANFENAHSTVGHPTDEAMQRGRIQYLRADLSRLRKGELPDDAVCSATVAIRLEGNAAGPLLACEDHVRTLIEDGGGKVHTRAGIRKERSYTSYAMNQFSYARALAPATGSEHPLAVFLPQRKTREWWDMDWMRRESFFLPRYGDDGTVVAMGHTLATAEGIPCLVRRLYHHPDGYGLESGYDFLGYFEFAEAHAGVFDTVMQRLRDRSQNPEWDYVLEGPEWWARRVGSVEALWD